MEVTEQRTLARLILAEEMRNNQGPDAFLAAVEAACNKLCRRLATLVTMSGSRRLLERALHLARAQYPFLGEIRIGTSLDVCIDGIEKYVHAVEPAQVHDGLVTVLAILIGLLDGFIGEHLTLRMVYDVWPDARSHWEEPDRQEA